MTSRLDPLFSSAYTKWQTPLYIYEPLRREFNIELDPCADPTNRLGCKYFFTEETDGLRSEWPPVNAFVNPPISAKTRKQNYEWIRRCSEHAKLGKGIVVLIAAARTDTLWWRHFIWNYNREHEGVEIRYPEGRIQFINPEDPSKKSPTFGSVIAIFRPPPGVTYVASSSSSLPDPAEINLQPNKLYSSLTDFAFPTTPN